MSKIIYSILMGLLFTTTSTHAFYCNYKDFFFLQDKNHPETYIVGAKSDKDINLEFISPNSFIITDNSNCKADGLAHIAIARNLTSWCLLDIKDGPFMMHPTFYASCQGMQFKGYTYGGFNSYTYEINFE